MDHPPAYHEALSSDAWSIIAPSIDWSDFSRLCLVSRDFYVRFAPRLWKDPLRLVTALGIHPSKERRWFMDFVSIVCRLDHLAIRDSTLAMVITIDLRVFRSLLASHAYGPWPDMTQELYRLTSRLSNLHCLILDGYTRLDFTLLHRLLAKKTDAQPFATINMFSVANCVQAIPAKFFDGGCLAGLIYLDLSFTGGWARNLLTDPSFTPFNLPKLHVLKVRGKNLDSWTVMHVLQQFSQQLWSFDLSHNDGLFSDPAFLAQYAHWSVPGRDPDIRLQTSQHFDLEGTLQAIENHEGTCYLIDESPWSATFCHPHRYFADAPAYPRDRNEDGHDRRRLLGEARYTRLSGMERIRGDSVGDVMQMIAGSTLGHVPVAVDMSSPVPRPGGLTHIHLNDLRLPAGTAKSLLSGSAGWIEHFECEYGEILPCNLLPDTRSARMSTASSGIVPQTFQALPGAAYLLRPAISSNLRSVRAHHSLITNIPTLNSEIDRTNTHSSIPSPQQQNLVNIFLAETRFCARLDLASPQRFTPDMNPRVHSLTLCRIPRKSTGVTTQRLIDFLKLAAAQEQHIALTSNKTALASVDGDADKARRRHCLRQRHHRAPPILRGLRHIVFEFDSGVPPGEEKVKAEERLLADARHGGDVAKAMQEFKSFRDNAWNAAAAAATASQTPTGNTKDKADPLPRATDERPQPRTARKSPSPRSLDLESGPTIEYLIGGPYDETDGDYVQYTAITEDGDDRSNNSTTPAKTTPIWIGCGVLHPANPPAINAYMRNISLLMPFGADSARLTGGRGLKLQNQGHPITIATPGHIAAGVPAGASILAAAWDAMMVPTQDEIEDAICQADVTGGRMVVEGEVGDEQTKQQEEIVGGIGGMMDVLEDLKTFRLATRDKYLALLHGGREGEGEDGMDVAQHWYWTGRLDIVMGK